MTLLSHTGHLPITTDQQCEQKVRQLNSQCRCGSLNREAIRAELWQQQDDSNLYQMIIEDRPNLFAESPVFVTDSCIKKQQEIIGAVEMVIALPAYQQRVLAYAPDAAKFIPKAHSVFFGYDFHLSPKGPQLIEINTNAGGALLNAIVARTQKACCDRSDAPLPPPITNASVIAHPEQAFIEMFLEEWQAERGQQPLRSIAIVDETPQNQYMLPEFILFKKLFEQHNFTAVICDPSELVYHDQALWHDSQHIDLVYNRLTDFGLEAPAHKSLLEAYLTEAVVMTPTPRAHALYANKKNLVVLTDEAALIDIGVDAKTRTILLNGIAHTKSVNPDDADNLWTDRKQLFFKPAKGYGSKAAYRGDKLTKRVFGEILQGDYVAQTLVQPSERQLEIENKIVDFKLDLRHYVYKGQTQLVSARLYQGQTTNFRTPGGGFAQVLVVPCQNKETDS
ncbi:hypothetical protein [Methylobacter sp. S3L5C]|uniref:hypothetical protein n=1 Tax=Methylobacter sp. S3L5C TaxID=2839024 RepID=UPI001FAE429F|nr:hypothetical protein [Methylobacter sp. S3L5C]UOA09424.1 hypothetical protein KKZ03_03755 [Methylobacter sp. S3L5C]